MTVAVNLLPLAYRRARRRRTRFHVALAVGATLIAAEFITGIVLHARTTLARQLLSDAETSREQAQTLQKEMVAPLRNLGVLDQQVSLARKLRATHRWSRLLAMVSNVAPENVTLTTIQTDPNKWQPGRGRALAAGSTGSGREPQVKPLVDGIAITGYAADHADLSRFIAELRNSGGLPFVEIEHVQREKLMAGHAIAFELRCRWK